MTAAGQVYDLPLPPDPYGPEEAEQRSSWAPIDLGPALAGEHIEAAPSVLKRDDGPALLYAGKVHSIAGEPESMKTWLALWACAQEITSGRTVLYVDFEDVAETTVERLRALGCTSEHIGRHLVYLQPSEPLSGADRAALLALVELRRPTLAVLDGVTEAMTLHGLDLYGNTDAAQWLAMLPRRPAVLQIDHVTKSSEGRGRFAIGAQHKLAGLSGAAYTVETATPFGRGKHGIAKVYIGKDRPGRVREHCPGKLAAELHLRSELPAGTVWVELRPPVERDPDEPFRPTFLMEKVSRLVEATAGGVSLRGIRGAVKGKNEAIGYAIELLEREGYIRIESGARGASVHHHVKPFREEGK
jgi:hypothetical protein